MRQFTALRRPPFLPPCWGRGQPRLITTSGRWRTPVSAGKRVRVRGTLAIGAHALGPQAPRSRAPLAINVTIDVGRGIPRLT